MKWEKWKMLTADPEANENWFYGSIWKVQGQVPRAPTGWPQGQHWRQRWSQKTESMAPAAWGWGTKERKRAQKDLGTTEMLHSWGAEGGGTLHDGIQVPNIPNFTHRVHCTPFILSSEGRVLSTKAWSPEFRSSAPIKKSLWWCTPRIPVLERWRQARCQSAQLVHPD